MIIAGGSDDDSSTTVQTTEILDLAGRRISKGEKMATPRNRFHMTTFKYNGVFKTLAVGGFDDGNNYFDTVEKWNAETESWSMRETRLKEKRVSFGLVAAPRRLICPS